jgi:hypothetical protein
MGRTIVQKSNCPLGVDKQFKAKPVDEACNDRVIRISYINIINCSEVT